MSSDRQLFGGASAAVDVDHYRLPSEYQNFKMTTGNQTSILSTPIVFIFLLIIDLFCFL